MSVKFFEWKKEVLDFVPQKCKLFEFDRCALKVNLESFNTDINRFQLDKLIANDEPIFTWDCVVDHNNAWFGSIQAMACLGSSYHQFKSLAPDDHSVYLTLNRECSHSLHICLRSRPITLTTNLTHDHIHTHNTRHTHKKIYLQFSTSIFLS